jgi:hypothetical protein
MGDIVKKYMDGELKVDEFITHRKPLGGVNEAFAVMKVCSSYMNSHVLISTVWGLHPMCCRYEDSVTVVERLETAINPLHIHKS